MGSGQRPLSATIVPREKYSAPKMCIWRIKRALHKRFEPSQSNFVKKMRYIVNQFNEAFSSINMLTGFHFDLLTINVFIRKLIERSKITKFDDISVVKIIFAIGYLGRKRLRAIMFGWPP